jgi:predicted acylesterase/phospholipase RssA
MTGLAALDIPAHLAAKIAKTPGGKKKLLALDGGGIRGALTLEILAKIEQIVGQPLGEYFDYIAGTSTGAIIATCLSLGMTVDKLREFYERSGPAMFDKASLIRRLHYKFEDDSLADMLRTVIGDKAGKDGAQVTLGDAALRSLLLIVMRNATTDSPWPVSNNPHAKYNQRSRDDCNLELPLWQLVRASTAAPTYFPPEKLRVGKHEFLFVDGGLSSYNNPAFVLFLMATLPAYRLEWAVGADDMLLVSVGTGSSPGADANLSAGDMHILHTATNAPGAFMYAALNEQDVNCRALSRCRAGHKIDSELGDLLYDSARPGVLPKLFTYMRYNAELTRSGLARLDIADIEAETVRAMDKTTHIKELQRIGRAVADRQVDAKHFQGFV